MTETHAVGMTTAGLAGKSARNICTLPTSRAVRGGLRPPAFILADITFVAANFVKSRGHYRYTEPTAALSAIEIFDFE